MIQIFTDAGQYVIRFGEADAAAKTGPATMVGLLLCRGLLYFLFWLFTLTVDI